MLFEFTLLKGGDGHFKVMSADEQTSKNGNPMLVLKVKIKDCEGTETVITEYMTKALFYKARSILRAGGMPLPHGDTKGEWGILDFEGKEGKCIIDIEPEKGNFSAKNFIKKYVEKGTAPIAAPMPAAAGEPADDIPW